MDDGELEAARRVSELLFKLTTTDELLDATLRCALTGNGQSLTGRGWSA